MRRFKEWNKHKNRNDYWVEKDSWILKHWQEVIGDRRTNRIALNEIKGSQQNIASSASELSKYISKAKSKEERGSSLRWYSFSDGYRGCKPKLGELGSTYVPGRSFEYMEWLGHSEYQEHAWELCNEEEGVCDCRRPVIYWDYQYRNYNEYRNVFINTKLIEMLVGGHKEWVLSADREREAEVVGIT